MIVFRGGNTARLALFGALACAASAGSQSPASESSVVGLGWARSSVNTVIFRTNSVITHGNLQYTAWYDGSAHVVLARRQLGASTWTVRVTPYTNDVTDAHNAIVLAVDGDGILHVAWAEHARALHYARGTSAGSLELGPPVAMTGEHEAQVTYPQFYALRGGDLLFSYRDGRSGKGDIMLNRWDVRRHAWRALAHPLISGEGARNAYVNTLAIDAHGGWHLTWCWRESPDVATNHDVLYAYSPDEGKTWTTSTGRAYVLPITAATAELAWAVPQGHELINQTTMTVDAAGHPMIATYWRPDSVDVPQLQLVWNDGRAWHASQVGARTLSFRLSGGGTKRIPISRPLVLADRTGAVHVIYRDQELGGGISVATSRDPLHAAWKVDTISRENVGQWEPTYDPVAWQTLHRLFLFVQRVGQGDGESLENVPPQPVSILEWRPR
ncbi:MAG: BNR repeat-containing protein [Gemmatimonadota bacterium]|nr:BNR repeat-containing protein [Gemmatimonadota bacterium]